jgi:transcriptional regulator with PAS, ATPase and Fis domain
LDNDQNDWIVVSKKNKKSMKVEQQKTSAIVISYNNDHLDTNPRVKRKKTLNWKDRRRQQQQKKVYDTIHIPNVPGRTELDLSVDFLEALKNISKVEHHTSKKYKGCHNKTKRVFPVIKGECVNCGRADHQIRDCYYRPSDYLVSAIFRDDCPDPNDPNRCE